MTDFLKGFVIAFSMYSKIPMPHIEWKEKNMRYVLCFFPCIGAVIGLVMMGSFLLMKQLDCGVIFRAAVLTLIPVWITGGIHMDGFMDTMDAMSSFQTKDRRLEILKDSHIGAFAAMGISCYLLLFFAGASEITEIEQLLLLTAGLVISRAMSAMSFVTCESARKDGLQRTFADAMQRKAVMASSIVYLIFAYSLCAYIRIEWVLIMLAATIVLYVYYRRFSQKNFGGITGDLAGYYLQLQEIVYLLVIVVVNRWI